MKIQLRLLMALLLLSTLLMSVLFISGGKQPSTNVMVQGADDTSTDEDDNDATSTEEEDDDDELHAEEEDEIEDAFEREVQVQISADQIEIESELKFGENKDKFEIQFEAKSQSEPEIEFEFSTETETVETELEIRIEYESIIEYVDIGTVDNGFQEGEEVSIYEFGEVDFNDIVASTETVSTGVDTAEVLVFTVSTTDGVFTLVLRISGALVQLEDATLTPNSLKIDVEINDFPYQETGSSLAIKTKVETESEVEYEEVTDEEEVGLGDGESQVAVGNTDAQGFYSWAETANADGQIINVISSSLIDVSEEEDDLLEGETSSKIYFSFITKDALNIFWDPKVGVTNAASFQQIEAIREKYVSLRAGGSFLPGFELVIAIISIFALATVTIKRRKQ